MKKRMRVIGLTAAVAVMAVSGAFADAFTDLRYTFSASTGNQLAALGGPSSGDLTASDITDTHASMATSSSGNNFYFNGLVNVDNVEVPVNYLTWTLTVDAGSQLELNEVKFNYWNEHPTANDGVSFALRSSLDGFTANLVAAENVQNGTELTLVADLDALGTTFDGLTGSVDFRIYTYGAFNFTRSSERGRLDSIYHTGETSVIPEPATMGLLVAGFGGMMVVRRRFCV